MIEYAILKLFINNTAMYDKYHAVLKLNYIRENFTMLYRLFQCLPAESISGLEANYLVNYPAIKQGDREAIRTILDSIEKAEADEGAIVAYLETHLSQAWANELALTALEVAQGTKKVEALEPLLAERTFSVDVEQIDFVSTDIEELLLDEETTGGLKWRLSCLNRSLGPLRKGNFGHIFARVNVGKTAMWVSEVTHMAKQTDKPILIFFNEEQGKDVIYRMYNAVTGMTYLEIANNPKEAKKRWEAEIGEGKIKFIDDVSLANKTSMEKIVEEVQPALVIIDNLDKVKGFSADRKDLLLHEIYKWGRDLAKQYCPVISVGQADASGHNSKVLDYSQMADSKTAKPSELDFIIGIGKDDKEGYENMRYITVSKNKLRGDEDTQEEMRHMKAQPVKLISQFSLYEDM